MNIYSFLVDYMWIIYCKMRSLRRRPRFARNVSILTTPMFGRSRLSNSSIDNSCVRSVLICPLPTIANWMLPFTRWYCTNSSNSMHPDCVIWYGSGHLISTIDRPSLMQFAVISGTKTLNRCWRQWLYSTPMRRITRMHYLFIWSISKYVP